MRLRMREAAYERNMQINELAEKIKTPRSTVYKWNEGVVFPNMRRIAWIAEELDCDPYDLIDLDKK